MIYNEEQNNNQYKEWEVGERINYFASAAIELFGYKEGYSEEESLAVYSKIKKDLNYDDNQLLAFILSDYYEKYITNIYDLINLLCKLGYELTADMYYKIADIPTSISRVEMTNKMNELGAQENGIHYVFAYLYECGMKGKVSKDQLLLLFELMNGDNTIFINEIIDIETDWEFKKYCKKTYKTVKNLIIRAKRNQINYKECEE